MADGGACESRGVVERYVHHKLLQRGYVWETSSSPPPPPSSSSSSCASHAKLHRVLREAGERVERAYRRDFAAMPERLRAAGGLSRRSFAAVAEELFRDGVNWGRVVAFLEFGCALCVDSVGRDAPAHVDSVARWMSDYLDGPLQGWIRENGGWDAFVELYDQQRNSMFHCSWPNLKTVFGLAALGAAGVTIGAYFTQK